MFDDDTIAANSTAAGAAARAIVRLSGGRAIDLAAAVFRPAAGRLSEVGGFRCTDGLAAARCAGIELPARAYVFRAPRSYTRQDVVELHVPGAAPAATALLEELIDAGARQAEPGEFTERAFLAGRIDLSAAEAVADVINAADDAQLRAAVTSLGGCVHRLCEQASSDAAEVLAAIEASIDLADEDVQFDSPAELAGRLAGLAGRLRGAADRAADMPEAADTPHVVLAGRPNVGKSSLLNALSGSSRAIVSALAGTTRDVLSASMTLGASAVTLQDAAGLAPASDPLAAAANSAARQAAKRADVILFVVDAAADGFEEDLALLQEVRRANGRAPLLVLVNKIDLAGEERARNAVRSLAAADAATTLTVSATRGDGLDALRQALCDLLHLAAARGAEALGLHQRQKRCLLAATDAIDRASALLAGAKEVADVAELAAVEMRSALAELGRISGQVVTEDILGRIFARFCVGK
ncbi:MAG TPA: GTPase [Phycisphaerae bacterium]|nr:GTPase [Phycisphaerae bacterium]